MSLSCTLRSAVTTLGPRPRSQAPAWERTALPAPPAGSEAEPRRHWVPPNVAEILANGGRQPTGLLSLRALLLPSADFSESGLANPSRKRADIGKTGGLTPNATYFVAARREPSGITVGKPGGLRRSANKNAPNGPKVSGIGLTPAVRLLVCNYGVVRQSFVARPSVRVWAVVWAAAALTAVLCPPPSARAAEIQLRWQLAPGTALQIQLAQTSKTETTIRDRVTAVAIDTGLELPWNVDRVDPDGTLHVTQAFSRLWLRSVSPDGKTTAYDSSLPPDSAAETKAIADAVRMLLQLRVSISLSKRGEILAVQRPSETDSLLGDLPALAGWKSLLTRDGMQRTLHQALGTLPAGPVDVGSTWNIVRQLESPLGPITATDTYTYEGPSADSQHRLERIRVATQLKLPDAAAPSRPPKRVERQQLEGSYLFDATAGFLAESRMTQTLVSEVPYGDGTIRVLTASSLVTKLARVSR